ncbi:hypothetical protein F5Y10DRAFT_261156 [Nemania abortiva]|nr:hypothetical protein F5Y10DRAFT_261156 [Nemania abortiva]
MSSTGVGALIQLTSPEEGDNVWTAEQIETASLPPPGGPSKRLPFDWSFGPVKISGYIDTSTLEIEINAIVMGITLGTVYGNLNDGVVIKVNLIAVKGEIRFFLKNGNELWVGLHLEVIFDGTYEGDYKIFSW